MQICSERPSVMPNTSVDNSQIYHLAAVDGWGISISTLDTAVRTIIERAESNETFTVLTLNLEKLVKLQADKRLRAAYDSASLISAEGRAVAWLSRLQRTEVSPTVGHDLTIPLAVEAARRQIPVYLVGSSGAVIGKAAQRLGDYTSGLLDIAGSDAVTQGFDPEGPDADSMIAKIAASGARLALISLAVPDQELFAARAQAQGVRCGFVCVGPALDELAGKGGQAPQVTNRSTVNSLQRLASEPGRLAARCTVYARVLARLVFASRSRQVN